MINIISIHEYAALQIVIIIIITITQIFEQKKKKELARIIIFFNIFLYFQELLKKLFQFRVRRRLTLRIVCFNRNGLFL